MNDEQKRIEKFICRVISGQGAGKTMVFLHGYMFTGEVWKDIGLLSGLEENKIPFTAPDMPYGHHAKCQPKSSDPDDSINIVKEITGKTDILIGASMGGNIALRYAVKHPVGGLVLIAPVGSQSENLVKAYDALNAPVLIVYGEKDAIVEQHEMEDLSKQLNAPLHIYEKAGHPAYLDLPEKFISDVMSFHSTVKI